MELRVPRVCIGLPVHNGEDFLEEALDSLLSQSFGDFEVIISDNASTDGTGDICRSYFRQDRRILYSRIDDNIGAGPNFNLVFGRCRSPYFKWMVHDDVLERDWLARCVGLLDADAGAVLAHSAVRMIGGDGRPLKVRPDGKVVDTHGKVLLAVEPLHLAEDDRPERRFEDALRKMTWCVPGLGLIRADALRRTHLHGPFYGSDYVLLAELALLGRFRQDEEPLYLKRCHAAITVHKSRQERAKWINPTVSPGVPGLRIRLGYLRALAVRSLTLGQWLRCLGTVARVAARNPLLHRLLPYGLRSLPVVGPWLRARG
jgi:glycosyltransferase involved in cell wall biosynthesis